MRFDRQTRRFFMTVLALILLMTLCLCAGAFLQRRMALSMLIEHDQAVVSYLLEQGVSEQVAAKAAASGTSTPQGIGLMNRIGLSETTDAYMVPAVRGFMKTMNAFSISWAGVFSVSLILAVLFFLKGRDSMYRSAAKTISRYTTGDFSALLPCSDNGTVYQLFSQINTMATALKAKQEAEVRARAFLKNTVSDISHQLKTPLAALSMYSEIILNEPDSAETAAAFAQKSQNAVARMEQLIQSLLKITRLDAGGIRFRKADYPVTELVMQSVENLMDRAEKEGKTVIVPWNKSGTVCCDLVWTREAVGNIVKNALDHTDSGGVVRIDWEQTPLMLRLSVSDNGKGIAEEDFHHIFKRFYRSKNSLDTQGIGLGLPLAKAIAEGQGGTITVSSRPGEGTAFTVSFPNSLTKL